MNNKDGVTQAKDVGLSTETPLLLQEFDKLGTNPSTIPSSLVPLQFFFQRKTWDCGLACAAMVLSLFSHPSPSLEALEKLCATKSVWTIDLAYLLRRCSNASITLTTTYLGLNPKYREEKFYADHVDNDNDRVNSLFQQAESHKISVVQRSVSAIELKFAVGSGRFLVVVLVDKAKLGINNEEKEAFGYIGHFILLHGYDSATDSYLIKDPAVLNDVEQQLHRQEQHQKLSADKLEVARLAHGTDEDLLFIELPNKIIARHSY